MSSSAETFGVFFSEITLMKWNLLQSVPLIFILSEWKSYRKKKKRRKKQKEEL